MIYAGRILKLKCTVRFINLLRVRLPILRQVSLYLAASCGLRRTQAVRRQGSQTL